MTLLAPSAAWLLLLLPILVLLYFLKLRRPRLKVSSTLLWRRMLQDSRVNTPFQRLKRSLLLILQIAVLATLAVTAARPLQQLNTLPKESILVLIDQSASMQTAHGRSTRFDEARKQLLRLIDDLGPRSEMAIAGYAANTSVLETFTTDHRRLASLAKSLEPTDGPDDPAAALELASALVVARPQTRVVLISDTLPASSGAALPYELEFVRVGTPTANLAITGGEVRRRPDDPNQVELHLMIRRFGQSPPPLVRILLDDKPVAVRAAEFGELDSASLIFNLSASKAAILEARIEADDGLAVDNVAWFAIPPPRRLQVALVGPEKVTRFFASAIKAMPFAELTDTSKNDADAVVAVTAKLPDTPPERNEMLILAPAQQASPTGVIDWQDDAPLCRFLDLSNLRMKQIAKIDFPENYRILATCGNTPLIAELSNGPKHRTVITFSPEQSNWPLHPSFPLFLHNWTNLLARLSPDAASQRLRVGERRAVAPAPTGTQATISGPTASAPHANVVGGRAYVSGLDKVGVYQLTLANRPPIALPVNLFDANESNLMRQTTTAITSAPPVETIPPRFPSSREWTTTVAALAFLLLCLEWSVHHRLWGGRGLTKRATP